ncbi:pyruvate ferredoxin oxidoreductase gamma subunit [Desulfacinum infernum DSM 9756]|uniref:Pyruvate ferredoxin oxidoreductase gamma subunit n=1 Tax=Desulfacinum infernum DSM 9756 TaxID=1121391 RepID=A0A1M4SH65_9BACT|nr:2-oxoacid:acceptor oxidoreductase family protein [Desulfacinum infernum]SHE31545.1 pyruvate ferredoxin oxidoreductase gamma subunit [Desulfacinum infernum DSM 9756]
MKRKYLQVRWHGRGGQGAVTAAMILSEAAFEEGYRGVTAAPFFGAERRGAPVIATNRFSWRPIRTYSLVVEPDMVVVLDETLLETVDVTAGLAPDGLVLINSRLSPEHFPISERFAVATTDATRCAKEAGLIIAGTVLSNTAILGGFARATSLVSLESLDKALANHFQGEALEKNRKGARLAFERTTLAGECTLQCA